MSAALDGEGVYLRPLRESDVEDFCAWFSDEQVTRFLGMEPLSEDRAKELFDQVLNDPSGVYYGIVKRDGEKIIGYVFLAQILKSHRVAREFGIVIGDKTQWGLGHGGEAARLMLGFGFKHMKLHKIELLTMDFNERARRVFMKLGFKEEGVHRESRLVDGEWRDVISMGILEKEYDYNSSR